MTTEHTLYKIIFIQEDKKYEIYARYVSEESLMGFIEIEELEIGGAAAPSEEHLQEEFKNVKRSYIPMYLVLRIDEVEKPGAAKITKCEKNSNVHKFPGKRQGQIPPNTD